MSKPSLPLVAIVGRPNVGKSSLFNRLVGERKAIVADTPGTTRDRVQAVVDWNGKYFWLVDTAGLEAGNDELVASMQEQIDLARKQADLLLIVIDSSTILSDTDSKIIKQAFKSGKPIIVAANKADRQKRQVEMSKLPTDNIAMVSAIHGTGSGDLLDIIVEQMPKKSAPSEKEPVLALLGRPNVGKSSLLNALSGEKRAVVSDESGTTRDVTETAIKHDGTTWRLLDTAGLRRIGKRGDRIEHFSALRSLRAINDSDVCVLVADANEPATSQDQRIAGMVREAGKGLIIAANKWDLTEREPRDVKLVEQAFFAKFQFAWWAPLLLISATEKHNINKLLPLAAEVQASRKRQLSTSKLNTYLQEALAAHPPAGLKNRHPKLKYITQVDVEPPTFTVFGSQTPYLHWSYKRYLETQLREKFDFTGTPVRFKWREGDKQKSQ